jgi:thiol-disulfide isomerase/thioredoxin
VLDVFAKFAGPCEAMLNVFKRLKAELAENIRFAQVH